MILARGANLHLKNGVMLRYKCIQCIRIDHDEAQSPSPYLYIHGEVWNEMDGARLVHDKHPIETVKGMYIEFRDKPITDDERHPQRIEKHGSNVATERPRATKVMGRRDPRGSKR